MVVQMAFLPYARPEGGLASVYKRSRIRPHAAWAAAALAVAGWLAASWIGLIACAVSLITTLLLAGYAYRKIGGFTGDVLGASCEIVEVIPALVAVAWAS
jgi:adenosylcobinamide-GDP ribazoletransferase